MSDTYDDNEGLQVPPPSETAKRVTRKIELLKAEAVRSHSRDAAIAFGRLLGEDTVRLAGEIGTDAAQRIARAQAYAAWEYDGKPIGTWEAYQKEFGLKGGQTVGQATRTGGQDLRPSDKKR